MSNLAVTVALLWVASFASAQLALPQLPQLPNALDLSMDFATFKQLFNKTYLNSTEDAFRKNLFLKKVADFVAHNADTTKTWQKGINQFTDMTQEEFRAVFAAGAKPPGAVQATLFPSTRVATPTAIDWRTKNAVTPVKDQGQCGSCWTFSTTGAIEGAYAIKHSSLISLSEEYIADCDTGTNGGSGCNGGWPAQAMSWVKTQGGIPTESAYPYTAGSSGATSACKSGVANSGVKVNGTTFNNGNETTLTQMVGLSGPVSIAIDAGDGCDWSSYAGGIFDANCYTTTDHAVLAVGYNITGGYWIVKNQWGTSWGEKGYIRLAYGKNMCGIANYGYAPITL